MFLSYVLAIKGQQCKLDVINQLYDICAPCDYVITISSLELVYGVYVIFSNFTCEHFGNTHANTNYRFAFVLCHEFDMFYFDLFSF